MGSGGPAVAPEEGETSAAPSAKATSISAAGRASPREEAPPPFQGYSLTSDREVGSKFFLSTPIINYTKDDARQRSGDRRESADTCLKILVRLSEENMSILWIQ